MTQAVKGDLYLMGKSPGAEGKPFRQASETEVEGPAQVGGNQLIGVPQKIEEDIDILSKHPSDGMTPLIVFQDPVREETPRGQGFRRVRGQRPGKDRRHLVGRGGRPKAKPVWSARQCENVQMQPPPHCGGERWLAGA